MNSIIQDVFSYDIDLLMLLLTYTIKLILYHLDIE